MENTDNAKINKPSKHISAFMGFLGAINSMAIGFYLLSALLNPILIPDLVIQGYILSPIIAVITILLVYGSYLILKNKNTKKGAEINFIAGLFLAFLYVYYAYFSQPPLLKWLAPAGILLVVPPILSGILSGK